LPHAHSVSSAFLPPARSSPLHALPRARSPRFCACLASVASRKLRLR
jgi:hypothetical protein